VYGNVPDRLTSLSGKILSSGRGKAALGCLIRKPYLADALHLKAGPYRLRMEQKDTTSEIASYTHSEAAFERVFKSHFKALYAYAFFFIKDADVAEDMVQTAFYKLWEKSGKLVIRHSVTAYLYRSVYHECLNYLKHQKVKQAHVSQAIHLRDEGSNDVSERVHLRELQAGLSQALEELPEGCRTIFQMSRFESLRYQEIADHLGISVKTVENQMGKALRILRSKLAPFLPLWFLVFCFTGKWVCCTGTALAAMYHAL